jgi:hypothetical protein
MIKLIVLIAGLLFAGVAIAEDPCEGRNPKYCTPQPGPIVVEKVRVRPSGSIATTHDTVISQDGRILAVIKGKLNQSGLDSKTREELGYE